MSKYNSLHIILLYITHNIYYPLCPPSVARSARLFLFPLDPVICHDPCCSGVRLEAFFRKRNFFSVCLRLSLSLSLLHDPAGYVLIQSYLSCPIVSTIANARARARPSRNPRIPAYGTDSRSRRTRATLQSHIILYRYIGNRGMDTYNIVYTAVIYVYIIYIG